MILFRLKLIQKVILICKIDDHDKFPPYRTELKKYRFSFNFKCKNEKISLESSGNYPQPINIDLNTFKISPKNIKIEYSLISCPLKKLALKISANNKEITYKINFVSISSDCRNIMKVFQMKKSLLSHNDILKFIEFINKYKIKEDTLELDMIKSIKEAKLLKILKFYDLPLEISISIVFSSIRLIDLIIAGSHYCSEINLQISQNYLDIRRIEENKIFSLRNEIGGKSNSLKELSSIINIITYKSNCLLLSKSIKDIVHLEKKKKSESWRLRNFNQILNKSYLGKLDILSQQNFDKSESIMKKIERLKLIFTKIDEANLDLISSNKPNWYKNLVI